MIRGAGIDFFRMPSLHALECLVSVADSGSVTPAGELRGVNLTSAGRAAVADARRAVEAAASAARSAIKQIRGTRFGTRGNSIFLDKAKDGEEYIEGTKRLIGFSVKRQESPSRVIPEH
jgi:hypothetical protein